MDISNINITDTDTITDTNDKDIIDNEEYISFDFSYNYTFQEKDPRDHFFTATINQNGLQFINITAPNNKSKNTSYSKSPTPPVYIINNLGVITSQQIGDCVANAFSYCISSQTYNTFFISRCHIYTMCRLLQNFPLRSDPGSTNRMMCNAILNYGAIRESDFPYISSHLFVLPSLNILKKGNYFQKFTCLCYGE